MAHFAQESGEWDDQEIDEPQQCESVSPLIGGHCDDMPPPPPPQTELPPWAQPPEPASEIHPRNLAVAFSPLASPMPPSAQRVPGTASKRRLQCVTNSLVVLTASGERVAQRMQVVLRIRPVAVTGPTRWSPHLCLHATSQSTIAIVPPEGSQGYKNGDRGQTYNFSQVFAAETSQQQYYEHTTAPLVTELVKSKCPHASVLMAYGITASGKTHTIEGTKQQPGVLPRAIKQLFEELKQMPSDVTVFVSYLEVYNEQVYDLLSEDQAVGGAVGRVPLRVKEDSKGHIYVAGGNRIAVSSPTEAFAAQKRGSRHRQRAGTALNQQSSRSHSIFTIYLKRASPSENAAEGLGQLSFVDLAGAERANRTGNAGARLKESVAINSSLMTLGRCMEALRWNQQHPGAEAKLVPYRESKVTHIFRDVLHGWGRLVLSVSVSPGASDYDESHNVLKYAQMATQISQLARAEAPSRQPRHGDVPTCADMTASKRRRLEGGGPVGASAAAHKRKGKTAAPMDPSCATTSKAGVVAEALREASEQAKKFEEENLDLRAENQALVGQVEEALSLQHAAEQEAALTESRVREEVSEEMSSLLRKMDTRYKERDEAMRLKLEEAHEKQMREMEEQHRRELEEALKGAGATQPEGGGAWTQADKEMANRCHALEQELSISRAEAAKLQAQAQEHNQELERQEQEWQRRLTQAETNSMAEADMLQHQVERQDKDHRRLQDRVQTLTEILRRYDFCSCGCAEGGGEEEQPSPERCPLRHQRHGLPGTPHAVALQRAHAELGRDGRGEEEKEGRGAGVPIFGGFVLSPEIAAAGTKKQRQEEEDREERRSLMRTTELFSRMQKTPAAEPKPKQLLTANISPYSDVSEEDEEEHQKGDDAVEVASPMEVEASQPAQPEAAKDSEEVGGNETAPGVEWIAEESMEEEEEPQGAALSRGKAKASFASATAAITPAGAPSEDYVTPGMPLSATFVLPEQDSGSTGAASSGGKRAPSPPQEVPQAAAAAHSSEEELGMQISEGVAAGKPAAECADSEEPDAAEEAMEPEPEPMLAASSGGAPTAEDPWQEDLQQMAEELKNDARGAEKSKAAQEELQQMAEDLKSDAEDSVAAEEEPEQMSEELKNDQSDAEEPDAAQEEPKQMSEELKNDQSGADNTEVAGEAVDPWLEDLQQMSEELKKDLGGAEKEAEAAGDPATEAVAKPDEKAKSPQEQPKKTDSKKGGRRATTAAAIEAPGGSVGEVGNDEAADEQKKKKPSGASSRRRLTRIQKELAWSADINESTYYGTDDGEASVGAPQQQEEGDAEVSQKPGSGVSTRRRSSRRATMLKEQAPNMSLPSASGSEQEDESQVMSSRRRRRASVSSNEGPVKQRSLSLGGVPMPAGHGRAAAAAALAPLGSISEAAEEDGDAQATTGGDDEAAPAGRPSCSAKEAKATVRVSADLDQENATAGGKQQTQGGGGGTPGVILKEWDDAQKRRKRRLGPATALLSLGSNLLEDEEGNRPQQNKSQQQQQQVRRSSRRRASTAIR